MPHFEFTPFELLLGILIAYSSWVIYRGRGQPLAPRERFWVMVTAVVSAISLVLHVAGPGSRASSGAVLMAWACFITINWLAVPRLIRAYSAIEVTHDPPKNVALNGLFAVGLAASALAARAGPKETAEHVVTRSWDAAAEVTEDVVAVFVSTPSGPVDPVWNLWVEKPRGDSAAPRFRPLRKLEPDTDYQLFVDLSGVPYGTAASGVNTRALSPTFARILSRLPEEGSPEPFEALLLVDDVHFHSLASGVTVRSLPVDVANIRAFRDHPPKALRSPLVELRRDPDSIMRFGKTAFPLRTTNVPGTGSLTVSIWSKGRSIEEIPATFCIGSPCAEADEAESVPGTNSFRVAAQGPESPELAVDYVTVGPQAPLKAVFRAKRSPGRVYSWNIDDAERLKTRMSEVLADLTGSNVIDGDMQVAGDRLFSLLFPARSSGHDDAMAARAIVEDTVRAAPPRLQGSDAPSFHIRLIEADGQQTLLPLNLMYAGGDFVGFRLRVESPLAAQDYSMPPACVRDWRAVFPPVPATDDELGAARARALRLIEAIPAHQQMDLKDLRKWLGSPNADAPMAILVLSHHSANRLYFQKADGVQSVHSSDIVITLPRPSVAILTACGTAESGGSDIIRALSTQGVSSVIATSTEVEPEMTGNFLGCIETVLRESAPEPIPLWSLYRRALACLDEESGPGQQPHPYGARILKFQLYGSGLTTLCEPAADPRRAEPVPPG